MRYILLIVCVLASSAAYAGNSNFYGADGSYLGTMAPAGPNNNFVYGSDGSYVGSTARAGNNTFIYGSDGSYVGQVINSPLITAPND